MCVNSGVWVCVCKRVCMYVVYVCMKKSVYVCTCLSVSLLYVFVRKYLSVLVCACPCVCMFVYMCCICVCFCVCGRRECADGTSLCAHTETRTVQGFEGLLSFSDLIL